MKRPWTVIGLTLGAVVGSVQAFGNEPAPTPPPIVFYGFVLPTVQMASGAVESFSQPNMSAYTAAGNPVLGKRPEDARGSFEVVQSRLGFNARPAAGTLTNLGRVLNLAERIIL
jgi:hypothetical protein